MEIPYSDFTLYIQDNWENYRKFIKREVLVEMLSDDKVEYKVNKFGINNDQYSILIYINPPDDPIPDWYKYSVDSDLIMKDMEVTELEDEWYYVTIRYSDDNLKSISLRKELHRVFKCDQWDGLIKFLKDYQVL